MQVYLLKICGLPEFEIVNKKVGQIVEDIKCMACISI